MIVRRRSARHASRSSSLSSASESIAGIGTRWRRRKRPTPSPSTPPFSCAPRCPLTEQDAKCSATAGRRSDRLDPPAAQHLHHRRLQIVVADQLEDAAEPLQAGDVALQERLLGLALERHHEPGARKARAQHEQMHHRHHAAQHHRRLAPVDLGLRPRLGDQRHERLADLTQLAPPLMHVARDLALRHPRAMLLDQPLPDPARRVTLLARRLQVRLKPCVDHLPIGAQRRRRSTRR